jgi:ApbE superfamily uncharacterized protein (UPF0280 family)
MTEERGYRALMQPEGLVVFEARLSTSDLWIAAESELRVEALTELARLRSELMSYLRRDPRFAEELKPWMPQADAPEIAVKMAEAAARCGVGPMAAVAGAFAEAVGRKLLESSREVRVENGGDCFLAGHREVTLGLFAGESPLTGQLGFKLRPDQLPCGVCTSSGTVGPSLSFGKADATVIFAEDAALADACATATGNLVKTSADFEQVLAFARGIKGVWGAALVVQEEFAAWGDIELVRLETQEQE